MTAPLVPAPSPRIPWRRALTEGAVIVGSILLAFAIDAWWAQQREQAGVRSALEAVRSELLENDAYFQAAERDHRRVADAGFQMLRLTGPTPSPDSSERAKFLIGELWVRAGNNAPAGGAISTLIASGDLARIRSPELREALSLWPNYIARQQELMVEIGRTNRVTERMILHVAQLDIDLINGMGDYAEARAEFVERAPEASAFPSDYAGLLAERQFESAVTGRTTTALIGIELTHQARERIADVLALLDAEIQ